MPVAQSAVMDGGFSIRLLEEGDFERGKLFMNLVFLQFIRFCRIHGMFI